MDHHTAGEIHRVGVVSLRTIGKNAFSLIFFLVHIVLHLKELFVLVFIVVV